MKISNSLVKNERGATIVYFAIILGVLLIFTALAIDVGHLYGVRNELQNAADAGSLAGAGVLFNSDGTLNRDGIDGALAVGDRTAKANETGNQPVAEVIVEIGHWSFSSQTFNASDATEQIAWQEKTFTELDTYDPVNTFINAVRVRTGRSDTPSFFARILGPEFDTFSVTGDAVAYIGFPSTVFPQDVDQPIAICQEAITVSGAYECNVGRFINNNEDTGGWTNLEQPDSCSENNGGANAGLKSLICSGNTTKLDGTKKLQVINGELGGAYNKLHDDCWWNATKDPITNIPSKPFEMTLPVIECGTNGISGCKKYVGIVTVDVIWINDELSAKKTYPRAMSAPEGSGLSDFTCAESFTDEECWTKFVDHFGLEDAEYRKNTIYFLPSCDVSEPVGTSGGLPFGVLAEIPVLVE